MAIGKKRVVIKPNNVSINIPLASTHADTLEGVLEFLKSIGKLENVIIAESAANGPTLEGFSNFGYNRLADKYKVKLVDLDQEFYDTIYVFDEKDFRPHPVRMSHMLLDPDSYIISVGKDENTRQGSRHTVIKEHCIRGSDKGYGIHIWQGP